MTIHAPKFLAAASVGAVLVTAAGVLAMARPAAATAQFAAQTGKSCGDCHTAPGGGGPLTPYGAKFKANGNKAPKQP